MERITTLHWQPINNVRISDPIMKEFEFNDLAKIVENHAAHLISISHNKEDLLFKLSGFLGGVVAVLKEKYPVQLADIKET